MKQLGWLLLIFFGAPGFCDMADPHVTLGIAAPAKTADINRAFTRQISGLMNDLMRGDPVAIDRSQALAKARMMLIAFQACEASLDAMTDSDNGSVTTNNNDVEISFLNEIYPKVFSRNFQLFNDADLNAIVEVLAQNPRVAILSLTMTDGEFRTRLPGETNPGLLPVYQKIAAPALGKYLRLNSLKNPALLQNFEIELTFSLRYSQRNEQDAKRLLAVLHDLALAPGPAVAAVIPLLDDHRNMVVRLSEGVLISAAKRYGLPLSFEEPLLRSGNDYALRILASSRKALSPPTVEKVFAQLEKIQSPETLRMTVYPMLEHDQLRDRTLEQMRVRQANTNEPMANRLFASEILLDNHIESAEVEYFLVRALPFARVEEFHQLANWCYGSDNCPPSIKAMVQRARARPRQ